MTFVSPAATTVTVLPSESTTLPPSATVRLETVESLVTTHVDVGSTLTLRGLALVDAVSFWVMAAAPVQVVGSVAAEDLALLGHVRNGMGFRLVRG